VNLKASARERWRKKTITSQGKAFGENLWSYNRTSSPHQNQGHILKEP